MTATAGAPRRGHGDRPRPPPQGGPAADHRPHPLDRQHHAAGDAAPGDGAQPVRARQDHQHRHQRREERDQRRRRAHRRRPRRRPRASASTPGRSRPTRSRPPTRRCPSTGSPSPARSSPSSSPARAAEARDAAELVDVEYDELPAALDLKEAADGQGPRAPRPRHQQVGLLAVRLRRGRHRRQRRRGDREGPRRRHRDRARVPPAAADPGVHGAALGRGRPDRRADHACGRRPRSRTSSGSRWPPRPASRSRRSG